MRKGNANLHSRKEPLRRSHGGAEIDVPGDEDEGVAGVHVKQLDGFHAQGNVGFLLLEALDPPPAVGAGEALSLEIGDVEVGVSQCCFGVADREVEIEPIHQEGHPVGHRVLPQKKNPTGRNPWGPGEARRTARGGIPTSFKWSLLMSSWFSKSHGQPGD